MSGVLVSIHQANTRRDHNPGATLRRLSLAASCVALMAGAAPAFAAETPASPEPTTASADDAVGLDAVVVTARRRDEDAQTVPVAVSAFGGAQLEAARAFNVRDLQTLSPSLSVSVTTRAPRPGETDGVEYHFVDQAEFDRMVDEGYVTHSEVVQQVRRRETREAQAACRAAGAGKRTAHRVRVVVGRRLVVGRGALTGHGDGTFGVVKR